MREIGSDADIGMSSYQDDSVVDSDGYTNSFASFINQTESLGNVETSSFEVIFSNVAFTKMTNINSTKTLNNFIEKAAFSNQQLAKLVSLKAVAQNRYSR